MVTYYEKCRDIARIGWANGQKLKSMQRLVRGLALYRSLRAYKSGNVRVQSCKFHGVARHDVYEASVLLGTCRGTHRYMPSWDPLMKWRRHIHSDTEHDDGEGTSTSNSSGWLNVVISVCDILETLEWNHEMEQKLVDHLRKMTPDSIVEVVKRSQDRNAALKFACWATAQKGVEFGHLALAKVVGRLGRTRDFDNAWKVLVQMKGRGYDVNHAFSVHVHRLGRAKMAKGIVDAINSMGTLGISPTIMVYTTAVDFLMKADKFDEARKLFKQMGCVSLVPDQKMYEVMIKGLSRARRFDEALVLFAEMKSTDYKPSVAIYTALIAGLSMGKELQIGKKFYEEMIENNIFPKVFSRHEVACALHGKKLKKKLDDLLVSIQEAPADSRIHSYHNVIEHLLETNNCDEAMKIFERIPGNDNAGTLVDELTGCRRRPTTYRLMFYGLCKQGCLDHAFEVFKEMVEEHLEPNRDIYDSFLIVLSDAKKMDEAIEVCGMMNKAKMKISTEAQQRFFGSLRLCERLSQACKIFGALQRSGSISRDVDFAAVSGVTKIADNGQYKEG